MNPTGAAQKLGKQTELTALSLAIDAPHTPKVLTREARRYGVGEIAARAGVSKEFCKSWHLEIDEVSATIYLEPTGKKKIIFPVHSASAGVAASIVSGKTSRAAWAYPPETATGKFVPDFVVPFVGSSFNNGTLPIFTAADADTVRFNFDLPAAALYTLSRLEESLLSDRDIHGRFPACASIAARESFLDRPIIDEYGFALEQALRCLMPGWRAERKPLRVRLTHDVDEVGIPFLLRSSMAHTLQRHNLNATIRDLLSLATDRNPAYLQSVLQLAQLSKKYDLDSAFYWKASPATKYDSGYDPGSGKVLSVFSWLNEHGFECGVHPGYETFLAPEKLRSEVERVRHCTGTELLGGRQHYLRWLPETWRHWQDCGLAYDSSVGFADSIGFRAGTCIPYYPWLWEENCEASLIEIPLLVMDRTLAYYMKLSPRESLVRVLECVEKCRAVGGVFTILWHNEALIDPLYGDFYTNLLQYLSGSERFDWRCAVPSAAQFSAA